MRLLSVLILSLLFGCRAPTPENASEVQGEEPAQEGAASAPVPVAPPGSDAEAGLPRVTTLVDELVSTVNAALAGRELPETTVALPGVRGEQVVTVQGDEYPGGDLEAVASLLKVDVTLDGCGQPGGLTLGLLQTARGVFLVGLGDQFTAASLNQPSGLEQVIAATDQALAAIGRGEGQALVLPDETCAELFGGAERCRQLFREIPDEATLERYRAMLSGCEARPRYHLDLISLWLRDQGEADFQGVARLTTVSRRLTLPSPIVIAPGPP